MVQVFGVTLAWPVFLKLAGAVLAVLVGSILVATWIERAVNAWAQRWNLAPDGGGRLRIRRYVLPVLLVGALHVTLGSLDLPRRLHALISNLLVVTNLTLALYLIAQLSLGLLGRLTARSEEGRRIAPQVETIARLGLLVVFGALLLDNLGIHLTALLTTLGIGSLAVALALQDTLSNVFAGLYLQADRPVRVGDFVRLDTGDEGTVMRIGWRSTRLRTLANNTVVLPNERLSKAVITNYDLPESPLWVEVHVTVPYDTDLERAERLLLEAAQRGGAESNGLLDEPSPTVRLAAFEKTGLELALVVRVAQYRDQMLAQHVLRKHILAVFRAEAIGIAPSEVRPPTTRGTSAAPAAS